MNYTYLMNFSADSSALVCVQGTDQPQVFNIILIKLYGHPLDRIVVVPCKVAEDYPIQIDASLSKKEIYMISKSETASRLHIYDFDRRLKKSINDARALSVSTDEKILAYATASKEIKMICIKEKEKPKAKKGSNKNKPQSRAPSRKGTLVNDGDGSDKNFNPSI